LSDALVTDTNDVSSAASRGRASAGHVPLDDARANVGKPQMFASPETAVRAFIAALREGDLARLQAIFVDTRLISSGDEIQDRLERQSFLREYDRKHWLRRRTAVVLHVGESASPFAVPIVEGEGGYYFDSAAGAHELLLRRIGRNELGAIAMCAGYVTAQNEYASVGHDGGTPGVYARQLMSDQGKHNGLFWPAKAGEPPSPAALLLAAAEAEGYPTAAGERMPYHGYLYRNLTAQSRYARDGARDYFDGEGRQVGGFAMVAYPAEYGRTGVKTFIVNQDSIVYEKDLGTHTPEIVSKMREFDPEGWQVVGY